MHRLDYVAMLCHVCLWISHCNHYVHGELSRTQEECTSDMTRCFTLYKAQSPITWSEASRQCRGIEQELAAIPDSDTQDVVSRFKVSEPGHAWVGARRSDDLVWRDLNGNPFKGSVSFSSNDTLWCATLSLRREMQAHEIISASRCQDSDRKNALCLLSTENSPCATMRGNQLFNNISNTDLLVSGFPFISWNDARQFCARTCGGSLASGTLKYMEILQNEFHRAGFNEESWVGYERRPWNWTIDGSHLSFTNWRTEEGADTDEECLHVDLAANNTWSDKPCDSHSKYAICQRDTSGSTSRTFPPDVSDITPDGASITINDGLSILHAAVVAGCVSGGAVIMTAIIAAVCVQRHKRALERNSIQTPEMTADYSQHSQHSTSSDGNSVLDESTTSSPKTPTTSAQTIGDWPGIHHQHVRCQGQSPVLNDRRTPEKKSPDQMVSLHRVPEPRVLRYDDSSRATTPEVEKDDNHYDAEQQLSVDLNDGSESTDQDHGGATAVYPEGGIEHLSEGLGLSINPLHTAIPDPTYSEISEDSQITTPGKSMYEYLRTEPRQSPEDEGRDDQDDVIVCSDSVDANHVLSPTGAIYTLPTKMVTFNID